MKLPTSFPVTCAKSIIGAIAATVAMGCVPAYAANHALIMTIGNYARPDAFLPGIDKDAVYAQRIAQAMGVADSNITLFRDGQLTLQGFDSAFHALQSRVQPGDGVFVYYSGHGGQVLKKNQAGPKKCIAGMVTHDVVVNGELQLYDYERLADALKNLAFKAGRLVMMNDSSSSVPVASTISMEKPKVKQYRVADADFDYACGDAVHKHRRDLFTNKASANMLYIDASSNREVAFPSEDGSLATVAWAQCLTAPDQDRSGALSGEELRACAQQRMDRHPQGLRQTITLTGNARLPLAVGNTAGDSDSAEAASSVNPSATLQDIVHSASSSFSVGLTAARAQMRIGQDQLEFTVSTSKPGYLYVLHTESDGKTFDLLFPNDNDGNNHIAAGTHQFPRPGWAMRSGGPAGTSYIMAMVSDTPGKFVQSMGDKAGPFAQAKATRKASRNLIAEATGADQSNPGHFGASAVVAIQEVQ